MNEDDARGATGAWVGLLGFSQGAKMAASLLFTQQQRAEILGAANAGSDFRFAVLLAGRAPLVSLDPELVMSSALADASQSTLVFANSPDKADLEKWKHVLRLPTIHVHRRQDQGLHLHRRLLEQYCEKVVRVWSSETGITGCRSRRKMLQQLWSRYSTWAGRRARSRTPEL